MLTRRELIVRQRALKRELARAGPAQQALLREALRAIAGALRADGGRDAGRGR
jgi:hypothetical protein